MNYYDSYILCDCAYVIEPKRKKTPEPTGNIITVGDDANVNLELENRKFLILFLLFNLSLS